MHISHWSKRVPISMLLVYEDIIDVLGQCYLCDVYQYVHRTPRAKVGLDHA
jgi:hypothetical protein